jgi:hypothetical protein
MAVNFSALRPTKQMKYPISGLAMVSCIKQLRLFIVKEITKCSQTSLTSALQYNPSSSLRYFATSQKERPVCTARSQIWWQDFRRRAEIVICWLSEDNGRFAAESVIAQAKMNFRPQCNGHRQKYSVAWVRWRTIPTERPQLVAEVSANFCGWKVPRCQCNGSPLLYSCLSRSEPLFFLSSSSSALLTRLSGPRSRPTTSQKIW